VHWIMGLGAFLITPPAVVSTCLLRRREERKRMEEEERMGGVKRDVKRGLARGRIEAAEGAEGRIG
jgi:hypothetical protein